MNLFTKHLKEVNETYFEHFFMASSFGLKMLFAGFACLLHGLFPFWFQKSGSNTIVKLHDAMVLNRVKKETVSAQSHNVSNEETGCKI